METKESDNLNRDNFLKMLKVKLKREINGDIFFMILVIPYLFLSVNRLVDSKDSFDFINVCLWGWLLLYRGWFTLFNYRFLKKVDNLDTPDRLLYWLEKRHRYLKIGGGLIPCILLLLFAIFLVKTGSDIWSYVGAIGMVIVAIVLMVYYLGGCSGWYRQEKDMIEQLRELVEKK